MTVEEFDEAQEKMTIGMRLSHLADKILPGGLLTHSLTGPTPTHPDLEVITDTQVETLTGVCCKCIVVECLVRRKQLTTYKSLLYTVALEGIALPRCKKIRW